MIETNCASKPKKEKKTAELLYYQTSWQISSCILILKSLEPQPQSSKKTLTAGKNVNLHDYRIWNSYCGLWIDCVTTVTKCSKFEMKVQYILEFKTQDLWNILR